MINVLLVQGPQRKGTRAEAAVGEGTLTWSRGWATWRKDVRELILEERPKDVHSAGMACAKTLWLRGECYILGTKKKGNVSLVQKI